MLLFGFFFFKTDFIHRSSSQPVIDCGFECFTCSKWLYFGSTAAGFRFGLGTSFRSDWWKSHCQVKVFISSLTPSKRYHHHHHGCNHSKHSPPRCKLLKWAFTLLSSVRTGNTASLLSECTAHECGLKWEMMPWWRCSVQSPGLEISIWVMAHKHLPDCVLPSAGMSYKVREVKCFHPRGRLKVPLSCLRMLVYLYSPQTKRA